MAKSGWQSEFFLVKLTAMGCKDGSDPRLEELIRIIHLWDSAYFLSIVSKTMAEELIRVRR